MVQINPPPRAWYANPLTWTSAVQFVVGAMVAVGVMSPEAAAEATSRVPEMIAGGLVAVTGVAQYWWLRK